jgi:hypothetical protein
MASMSIESPQPSANTNVKQVGPSWRQHQNVRKARPSLVVERLPNTAMEPSARELTLARRGSSLTLGARRALDASERMKK